MRIGASHCSQLREQTFTACCPRRCQDGIASPLRDGPSPSHPRIPCRILFKCAPRLEIERRPSSRRINNRRFATHLSREKKSERNQFRHKFGEVSKSTAEVNGTGAADTVEGFSLQACARRFRDNRARSVTLMQPALKPPLRVTFALSRATDSCEMRPACGPQPVD